MRTLPRMRILVVLPLLVLPALACDPAEESAIQQRADPPSMTPAAGGAFTNVVEVTLKLENGQIVTSPDSIAVERTTQVRWVSEPSDAVWVVVFPDGDPPFPNGKRVFNGGEPGNSANLAMIRSDAPSVAHKYWVFFPDASGSYQIQDPKLVVIDDDGMGADSTP